MMFKELATKYFQLYAGKKYKVVGVYFDPVSCQWKFNIRRLNE